MGVPSLKVAKCVRPTSRPMALGRGWQRSWLDFTGEAREPLARFARDRQRLDPALHGPMALDLNSSDLGELQVSAVHAEAELRIGERIESVRRAEAREPGPVASTHPRKEAAEGAIDAVQHVLQHLRVDVPHVRPLGLDRRQLRRLLPEADRDARGAPRIAAHLHGRVVELSAQPQVAIEPGTLGGRGIQPEPPRLSLFDRRRQHGGTVSDGTDRRGHHASDWVQGSRDSVQRAANRRGGNGSRLAFMPQGAISRGAGAADIPAAQAGGSTPSLVIQPSALAPPQL